MINNTCVINQHCRDNQLNKYLHGRLSDSINGFYKTEMKNVALARCINHIQDIKKSDRESLTLKLEAMIKFTLSEIVGTQSSGEYVESDVNVEVQQSIKLLTGNNSSWFGKDVTRGATILLYVLCCSYERAVELDDELPDMNSYNNAKLEFIKATLKSFDNGEFISSRIESKYLNKCYYYLQNQADDVVEINKQFNGYLFSGDRNTWSFASEFSLAEKVSHLRYLVNSGSHKLEFKDVKNEDRFLDINGKLEKILLQTSLCSSSTGDADGLALYICGESPNLFLVISYDNGITFTDIGDFSAKKEIGFFIDEDYKLAITILDLIKAEQQSKQRSTINANDGSSIVVLNRTLLLPTSS